MPQLYQDLKVTRVTVDVLAPLELMVRYLEPWLVLYKTTEPLTLCKYLNCCIQWNPDK